MDVLLYVVLLAGLIYCVSGQSQTTQCLMAETKCSTTFYDSIQKAVKADPDSVKNDPAFGCSAAEKYRDCLQTVTETGCKEMDEGAYQQSVKGVSVNLKNCWTDAASSVTVSLFITSILAVLAICLMS